MRGGRVGHYAHLWGSTFTYTSTLPTCPPAACHAHLHAQFHAPKNGHGGRAILLTHFCQQLILWPTAGMRIKSIKDTHTCSFDMQTCVCGYVCVRLWNFKHVRFMPNEPHFQAPSEMARSGTGE